MSTTIDQAFIKQFEREVHEAYQRQGSKLRNTVRALGWQHDRTAPLWRVEQDIPLSFTLLSVAMQIKVND